MNKNKIVSHPLVVSFIIDLVFLLASVLLCDPKYEVSDDYIIDAVLSGAYTGQTDPYLIFNNPILGFILKPFYALFPNVSIYFMFVMILSFISLMMIMYVILTNLKNPVGIPVCIIFMLFFSPDIFILLQFTKTAALAMVAGGVLILNAIWRSEGKIRILQITLGMIVAMLGAMLRYLSLYMVLPFLLLAFAKSAVDYWKASSPQKAEGIKNILFKVIPCIIMVGLIYALELAGIGLYNSDPAYKDYRDFNILRAAVLDTPREQYEDFREVYESNGLDFVDYAAVYTWCINDADVFTTPRLQAIADIEKQVSDSQSHSVSFVMETLTGRGYYKYHAVIGLILLAVLFCIFCRKSCYYPVLNILGVFAMFALFGYINRILYRVEFSVLLCAAVTLCSCYTDDEFLKLPLPDKIPSNIVPVAVSVVCSLFMMLNYIPDTMYKELSDDDYIRYTASVLMNSDDYNADKYKICVSRRRPYNRLLEYMEADDNYYLMDFSTCIQLLYTDYKPWERIEPGLFARKYAYFSGCTLRHPGEREAFAANGIDPDNPYKSITNDNVLVVDNICSKVKLAYIQAHYHPTAEKELVAEIDGLQIWRFYIPEE